MCRKLLWYFKITLFTKISIWIGKFCKIKRWIFTQMVTANSKFSYLNKYKYNLGKIEKLIQLNLTKDDLLILASRIGQLASDYNLVKLIRLCTILDHKVGKIWSKI